jgi:mRNA-degrading endonuclease RelE of RelBE toxin-antitoxin system
MTAWPVELTPEAESDLNRLKRPGRKQIRREALRLIASLSYNPQQGDACRPPLVDVRRLHFWRDKYRLAWKSDDIARKVYVLGVGPKKPGFYDQVAEVLRRLRAIGLAA